MDGLIAQARREATAPLLAEVEAVKAALVDARAEVRQQGDLIDVLHDVIEELRSQADQAPKPRSSLILARA